MEHSFEKVMNCRRVGYRDASAKTPVNCSHCCATCPHGVIVGLLFIEHPSQEVADLS